jgi:putative transposase
MKNRLERRYGLGDLHFITSSCYRRMPLLRTQRARNVFLRILSEVRDRYDFALWGYVVMFEHFHLLMGEPAIGTPGIVMQVLKQRVSRALRRRPWRRVSPGQMRLWDDRAADRYPHFWQRRFYDFNVRSAKKKNEKMNYMHFNPVKRGMVAHPKGWIWSSYRFYWRGEENLCVPNPERSYQGAKAKTHPCTSKGAAPTRLFAEK